MGLRRQDSCQLIRAAWAKTSPQCRNAFSLSPDISSLDFQCRDVVSKKNRRFGIEKSYLSIQELTPLPLGRGSVMLYASHVKLPPRYSAKMGTPRALACSSSSSTSTPVPQSLEPSAGV